MIQCSICKLHAQAELAVPVPELLVSDASEPSKVAFEFGDDSLSSRSRNKSLQLGLP